MPVIWQNTASQDLSDIRAFINLDNPSAAARVAKSLKEAAQHLSTLPERGRPTGLQNVRELVVTGTPYLLIYRVRADRVEILRVMHGARDRGG